MEFRKVFKSKQTAFYKYRLADRKCVKPWTYQTVINNSDGDSSASVNGCFQLKTYFCPHCWLESSYTKIIFIHDKCCCRLPHIWKLSSRTLFFTSFYQINMQSSILVLSLHSSCGFRCYWHCLLYNEHNTKWENSIWVTCWEKFSCIIYLGV